jgi:beta-glucosidase
MSDWYGTYSGAEALNAGLDLEMPGPSVFRGERLVKDIEEGRVKRDDVDTALLNVLTMIGRTAESHSAEPERMVICERTSSIARRIASQGIVFLKNRGNVLPLDIRKAPKLAIIGAPALEPTVSGGGSAFAKPQYIQRPYDCLKDAHPSPQLLTVSKGVNPNYTVPIAPRENLLWRNGQPGVDVRYYNDDSPEPVFSEFLETAQAIMLGYVRLGLKESAFHSVVSTTLISKTTGLHKIAVQVTGAYSVRVDDREFSLSSLPREEFSNRAY